MDDDDDIYGSADQQDYASNQNVQDMYDEEEGEADDDSDDDINFTISAKDEKKDAKPEDVKDSKKRPASQSIDALRIKPDSPAPSPSLGVKRETTPSVLGTNSAFNDGVPGDQYPGRHTSTFDPVNGNPILPQTGKPLLNTDLDSDFTEKPWRKPGTDISDYFNYGFDEFTWASWCLKKQQMPSELKQMNNEVEQMKAFLGNDGQVGGMPTMPAMPSMPAMPGLVGMPTGPGGIPNDPQMQAMIAQMMQSGMDPTAINPEQFMQMMAGQPGMQPGIGVGSVPLGPSGQTGDMGMNGQDHGGRGGRRGRGRGRGW